MTPTTRLQLTYVLPAVVLLALFAPRLWGSGTEAVLPYSQFQQLLAQDKVKQVVVDGESLRGELKEPLKDAPNQGRVLFVTNQVSPELAAALEKHGVTFAARLESPL